MVCHSLTTRSPAPLPSQEHQECVTVKTRFRPVPLHWHFTYFKAPKGVIVDDLLDATGKGLNQNLLPKMQSMEDARWELGLWFMV